MTFETVKIKNPANLNVIIGQAHFIKTVEDIYEVLACSSPYIKFGVAFCEASGPSLVRSAGNDIDLRQMAEDNAYNVGAGHMFIIFLREAFPLSVLNALKMVPEVCRIYCASANVLEVIVAATDQGKAILGVVDGASPAGIEKDDDRRQRKDFLRKIGYKL